MKIRTKIPLGFIVLALLAAVVGGFAIYAFQEIGTSLEEVRSSTPLLLATSEIKDFLSEKILWYLPIFRRRHRHSRSN